MGALVSRSAVTAGVRGWPSDKRRVEVDDAASASRTLATLAPKCLPTLCGKGDSEGAECGALTRSLRHALWDDGEPSANLPSTAAAATAGLGGMGDVAVE